MALKFRQDYGDSLRGSACLNPYTRQLTYGTNSYYQSYCGQTTKQLSSYLHLTNADPYFESYMYNAGITYKPRAYPNYKTMIYSYGQDMRMDIKSSEDDFAYFYAATDQVTIGAIYNGYNIDLSALNGQCSLIMENPTQTKQINLNLQDVLLTNAKEVKLREFTICDQGISKRILLFASDFYV
jgi:hypothetical protein